MAKQKKYNRISNAAAAVITWHDNMQINFDAGLKKTFQLLIDCSAAIITGYDFGSAKVDKGMLLTQYHLAKVIHKNRKRAALHKKSILGHAAAAILVAIAMVAIFNHATGFEYAYKGRALGFVNNQEDVLKILDMVSDELSEEYGSHIKIDKDNDISFRSAVTLDKDVDDVDTVLKRLTYMSDMEADAYAITINREQFVVCESKLASQTVLSNLQAEYMDSDNEKTIYERAGFKEAVEIRKISTRLSGISSVKSATKAIETGGMKETAYTVKKGDTYSEIFKKFDVTFKELKKINPKLNMKVLMPGQKILINNATSAVTVMTTEKSTYAEKLKYKTEYRKSSSMYKGDKKVLQKGINGKHVVTARITRENGKVVKKDVLNSEVIKKSVKKIVIKGTKSVPKTAPTGKYIIPVSGYTMTSPFGWRWGRMHEGVDLACATGTTIRASDGGTVVYAGWYSGYGLFIEIDHGGGMRTRYGHCSAIDVSVGEKVYKSKKIGEVGNTGNSFGSHCHFEITRSGSPVNPFDYT